MPLPHANACPSPSPEQIGRIANQLRIESIRATTASGSGHPTSCCSAADLVAALFFAQMRIDPKNPHYPNNDRFVLSKGHAAPLLYAAWAEAGHVDPKDLVNLRKVDSDLEGHPTPRLDFVDLATGSLGQGLSGGLGMAIRARIDKLDSKVYVLMGDGETAEGSVWEAASLAGHDRVNNLVAIIDVNRLGQSGPTAFGHDTETYRARFEAFGWRAVVIDGHDIPQILHTLAQTGEYDRPLAIIARTLKGKGIPGVEDQLDWHGKPLPKDQAEKAIAALEPIAESARGKILPRAPEPLPAGFEAGGTRRAGSPLPYPAPQEYPSFNYPADKPVAVRKAFGNALARIARINPAIVALDGDVRNSTYTQEFAEKFPDRFVECFIAEQNMVGVAGGLASMGKIAFVSTFAAFLSRAADQVRMAAISKLNLKLVGTHCGVSIGEDGPSQMGLEDLAIFRATAGSVVLSPCDAVSTERLVEKMADHPGICYLRAARPATPILYKETDVFDIGGCRVLRQGKDDVACVIATGVTVFEALKAQEALAREGLGITVVDAYSIKPLPTKQLAEAVTNCRGIAITVEDHFVEGGLGDAVAGELSPLGLRVFKLGVREVPHSGKEAELLAKYGIDAAAIAMQVQKLKGTAHPMAVDTPEAGRSATA